MSDGYDIFDWLGGTGHRKLRRHNRVPKIRERADDDNGNDDKSSQDYIPMERVSREFVKVKQQEDGKKLRKGIRDSLNTALTGAREPASEQPEFDDNAPMEGIARSYLKVKKQKEARENDRKVREAIDPDSPSVKKAKEKEDRLEAAMDEPVGEYLEQKDHYDKLKRNKQIKQELEKQDPDYKPSAAELVRRKQAEATEKLKRGPTTDSEVEESAAHSAARDDTAQKPTPPKPPTLIQPQQGDTNIHPVNLGSEEQQGDESSDRAQQVARLPSLVNQLPPTETKPIANVPGDYGELKDVPTPDPAGSKPLPLQLDVPANTDEPEVPDNSALSELSAEYMRAVSKPISVLGKSIDPASSAYEAVDRAIQPLQLMNNGLLKTPTAIGRLANFINYPLDKLAGTEAFTKNNAMLDRADSFIDSLGVTRNATNPAERGFEALGMLALPNPAALLRPVLAGGTVVANEGIHQTAEAVNRYLERNPRVQNKYDELEPKVLSVDKGEAKQIQQKLDADARSFIPSFAQANYTDVMAYTAGALVGLTFLYKGAGYLRKPVSGRTILNAEKPIVETTPESMVTGGEALRTINQNANYGLESQAQRMGNMDLVHDISTQTRAGLAARIESMTDTGAVNTPGFSTQLSVSPKQLVEFHLSRPEAEQQEVSKALHVMSQVDDAKLNSERRAAIKTSTEEPSLPPEKTIRDKIEDAYYDLRTDPMNPNVRLDKLRAAVPDVSRAQFDAVLGDVTSGRYKEARLSQLSDTKRITPAEREAAYSPAGEPFHTFAINGARTPKQEAPKLSPRMLEKPEQQYSAMPPEPDILEAQRILAKPENAGVVRVMQEIRVASSKIKQASGRWNEEATNNMLAKRPNYVHRVETNDYKIVDGQTVPKTRMESILDSFKFKRGDDEYVLASSDLSSAQERSRVNAPNQMLDAVLANVKELQDTVAFAHENDIVKRFHKSLSGHKEFEKAAITLKEGQAIPKGYKTSYYFDNGKKIRFVIDPLTANALKFNPTSVATRYNIANTIRNTFQSATTGPVLAPFFAGTSFSMEASITAATRNRSMRAGNIDAALHAATGDRLSVPAGNMFGTMAAGVGAVRRAQRADSLLHNIQKGEDYLLRYGNKTLRDVEAQMPGFTKKLARGAAVGQDTMLEGLLALSREHYEQTAKGWALKNGALHSSQNELLRNANRFFNGDTLHAIQRQLGQEEGSAWYNWYKNLILNIHDGVRLSEVEKNLGRMSDSELAYNVRRASGDLGVRGAGNSGSDYILSSDVSRAAQIATKALSNRAVGSILDFGYASIPYINPHIQGTTRFLEQLARQPTTLIAGAIGATTVPYMGSLGLSLALGPEYVDHLLNKREEYKKSGYIYFPIPGRPAQDGLDFRIDPVLAPFGYPILEALDSVFGIRQYTASKLGRQSPNAEAEGVMQALGDGLKEAIGFSAPIQASLALAAAGVAAPRNVLEPGYNVNTEQVSKLGAGKNTGSALSVQMQLLLEAAVGGVAQHAVAGMDAWASTGKKESALGNAVKGAGFSFINKAPVVSTMFTGKNFNESGTALAANTRQLTNSARRIVQGIQNVQNGLLKTANAKMRGDNGAVQPVKIGNPGITELPPEIQQRMPEFMGALNKNGRIVAINGERSSITTGLGGLRGINAGNLSRHVIVPLKEGREIAGLNYTIMNEELMKQEIAKETDSIINPKMTKGGKTTAPKEAKQQRALPIFDLTGDFPKVSKNGKLQNAEGQYFKPPTLKQVQELKNAYNERRYHLDLEAADEYESIEKQLGVKLNDLAKKVKLTPEGEAELASSD